MMETGKKPWLKALVRILIGGVVFGVLVSRTDVEELLRQLRAARPGHILAAIGLFFVGLGVSALRWREYLNALDYPMPYTTLYRLYFVGTFFNAFLPTGVGGDAYKAMRIGRVRGQTARVFSSVFLDRFAGIVGLALIGAVASLVRIAGGDYGWVPLLGAAAALGVLSVAAILLTFGERLLGKGRLIPHTGIGDNLRRTVRGIHEAGRHPRAAATGLLLGVVFQAIVVWFHVLLAGALGLDGIALPLMGSIVVLASVAVLAPISLSGLGVVEFVYVRALTEYGVSNARAVAFALLVRAVSLIASASGGVVYLVFGGDVQPVNLPEGTESPSAEAPH